MISITTAGFQFKYENQLIEIEKNQRITTLIAIVMVKLLDA